MAGAGGAADRGSGRHGGDHAPDRSGQALGLALAGALHRGRGRRPVARQDPAVAHPATGGRAGRRGPPHAGAAAGRGDPLDGARDGGASGVSPAKVQRIWQEAGLQPHRFRPFKLSNDPAFADKLEEVVALYVDPPEHAVVLSIDEKSQIQALDRTQPGLPMKKGRAGTMTHDYIRNGTTTLFAALNMLDGTVIGQCMQRHRHQEFIRFLNRIEREVPAGKVIHVVLDNYAAHKHPKVRDWLDRHPRWTFHFTPTSSSWLNAVEGFFAKLTRRRLKRGVFHSLVDLQAAINSYLAEHNQAPSRSSGAPSPKHHGQGQTRASNVRDDPLAAKRFR